jgi:pimeloyl-ACP methyl ester carboxylesterase
MTTPSRRAVLVGALGGAALGLTGCGRAAPRHVVRSSGTMNSSHWPGRDIRWQIARPEDGNDDRKPVVVVLHGKGGDASHAFRMLHLDDHAVSSRLTLASVDGGDHYWHARRAGMDTGAMVVEDFLPLVARETGYAGPVAFLGWSMGGYGSLLLASELGPDRVRAVVAESAALWTEPALSAPGAFDDSADFETHDVFERTEALAQIPVRLDCGRSDPFVAGNQAFAAALPSAHLTLDAGGHTTKYWQSHGAAQLRWVREQFDD